MPRLEQEVVASRERPRADERHLTAQDVDHVRDLVEREAPEEAPDVCDTRVVTDLEQRAARLVRLLQCLLLAVCPLEHRAELEHPELLLAEADARIGVEDGTRRRQ